MKNLRKNAKKNQKGFTLVEIIVVLVILAVLAAASIPTMLGFVEDSKGKAEIANARAAYVACQAVATEEKAAGLSAAAGGDATLISGSTYVIAADGTAANDNTTATAANNKKLNEMLGVDLEKATVTPAISAAGEVTSVVYVSVSGEYKATITAGTGTTVEKIK